jgi:nucleotide-binding universal stress UspA family protein
VCAVDATRDSLDLLRYAADLSATCAARIQLVHAVPPAMESGPAKYMDREFESFLKEAFGRKICELQKEAGTNFSLCIEAGKTSAVVAAAAEQHEAGLILIGRGVLTHFGGRLRTNVYSIIRDAPCPVLSV